MGQNINAAGAQGREVCGGTLGLIEALIGGRMEGDHPRGGATGRGQEERSGGKTGQGRVGDGTTSVWEGHHN